MTRRAVPILGMLVAALQLAAAPAHAARPLALPEGQPVLFTVQAEGGTLAPVRGKQGRFVLTLRDVASQGLWFTDRPARQTGSVRIGAFFGAWKRLGFRSEPPNAVIFLTGAKDSADAFAVELGMPRYDARTDSVRFGVRALDELSAGLSHLGPDLDGRIAPSFGEAALFIDDAVTGASSGGWCGYLGQLDVYPSTLGTVAAYFPADGRPLKINGYSALFSLLGTTFGGDGRNTFAVPKLTGPIDFLAYHLCSNGIFPARADDDYDGQATCDVGSIVLEGQQFQPAGWVAADGRSLSVTRAAKLFAVLGTTFGGDGTTTFKVPDIPAPKGTKFWVCANGDAWRTGAESPNTCTYSQVVLWASATKLPSNYLPADGRLLRVDDSQILYSVLGTTFGGDGINTFALPNVPAPVAGTRYAVCAKGFYPQRS